MFDSREPRLKKDPGRLSNLKSGSVRSLFSTKDPDLILLPQKEVGGSRSGTKYEELGFR